MDAADAAAEFLSHLNADRWMAAAAMVEPAQREAFHDQMLALLMALATSTGPVIAIEPDEPPPLPRPTPEQLARHAATLAPVYVQGPTLGYLAQLDPTAFLAYHWSDVIGHDRYRGRGVCQERREVTGRGAVEGTHVAVPYAVIPPPAVGGPFPQVLHLSRLGDRWHVALNDELRSWRLLR
jgi:hypothetical protein